MVTTIDKAGRVVIPKSLRNQLNFKPGQSLEISVRDGHLEIEPKKTSVELVNDDGVVVAMPDQELPPLTTETVRSTLEQTRP